MIIEIHGAGFYNKGAELMLQTVIYELGQRIPRVKLAIDPFFGHYFNRSKLSLMQMFPPRGLVGKPNFSKRFLLQKFFVNAKGRALFRQFLGTSIYSYGLATLNCVDALIDISGFAFTDHFGTRNTVNFASLVSYYRSKNKPVILLPQSFGPFKNEISADAFKKIISKSTLIFPRDTYSRNLALEACDTPNKIHQSPDITLFYPSKKPNSETFQLTGKKVCLVPNIRVLDQGKDDWHERYEYYLLEMIKELITNEFVVDIVVHDTSGEDKALAMELVKKANSNYVKIYNEDDPIKLKEHIGESTFIIGSRFHSLVAGFSSGIPALVFGWAHKYKALANEFGCKEFVIDPTTSLEEAQIKLRILMENQQNLLIRQKITRHLKKMRATNQVMWELVVETLSPMLA